MRRPQDWSPVDRSSDPTPGDPDDVADLAARYRRTAEAVRSAASGLDKLKAKENYVGKGGEKLRERSRDLADQVRRLEERYSEAAAALEDYHPQQYAAQVHADAALSRAHEAARLKRCAQLVLQELDQRTPAANETQEPAWVTCERAAAQRDLSHALYELSRAKADIGRAEREQEHAGDTAERRLKKAIDGDGLNDTRWDNAFGVVKTFGKVVSVTATVLGLAALFLGWVPVLGEILIAAALIATAMSLMCNLLLFASGKDTWRAAAWDVVTLATFGIGRALTAAGRLSAVAARGRAWNYAKTIATGNSRARYREARILIGGPLRQANRVIPRAAGWRLWGEGARAADPRIAVREGWLALSKAKPFFTSGKAQAEVRQALTTFSGGTWRGAASALAGTSGPDLRALDDIDESVVKAPDVFAAIARATRVHQSNIVPFTIDRYHDARDVVGLLSEPAVDPAQDNSDGGGSYLPPDFEAPSPHSCPPSDDLHQSSDIGTVSGGQSP